MSAGICHHFQSETNLRCWLRERPLAMSRRFFFHRTESHQAAKLRSTFPQLTYHAMTCLHKVISRHIPIHRKFFIMNFWSVIGFSSSQIRKTSAETESGKWFFPFFPLSRAPCRTQYQKNFISVKDSSNIQQQKIFLFFFLTTIFFICRLTAKKIFFLDGKRKRSERQDEFFNGAVDEKLICFPMKADRRISTSPPRKQHWRSSLAWNDINRH